MRILSALLLSALLAAQPVCAKAIDGEPPYEKYVSQMVEKYQIMDLFPDQTFRGKHNFTRAELAETTWRLLTYVQKKWHLRQDIPSQNERKIVQYFKNQGGDLLERHWALIPFQKLLAIGILTGEGQKLYPERKVTRFELASLYYKLADWLQILQTPEQAIDAKKFLPMSQIKDLSRSHWSYPAVAFQVSKGIMYPNAQGNFQGDSYATRYDLSETVFHLLVLLEKIHLSQAQLPPELPPQLPGLQKRLDGRLVPSQPINKRF